MRIVDHRPRRRGLLPVLGLALVVAVLAAGGFGLVQRDFLRRVKQAPVETLLRRPLASLQARQEAVELPTLRVHMKFKHYERILAKREEALRNGVLQTGDEDLVPAEIEMDGRTVKVRMRLKGDWPDHFEGPKWSYRVEVRKGDQLMGMRRFSLQHPAARRYLAEWAYLASVRREGLLAPRYGFVRVVFNGDDKGIYAYEEHFAKELLESQRRREGPILKFDEGPLWEGRRRALATGSLDFTAFDRWSFRDARVDLFGEGGLREDSLLWDQARAAKARLEAFQAGAPASEVFQVDRLATFLALSQVWGATHALIWHNLRFYADPVSTRLEPIAFDGEPMDWTREEMWRTHLLGGFEIVQGHRGWFRWMEQALEDTLVRRRYLEELHRLSDPAWMAGLRSDLDEGLDRRRRALRAEWLDVADPLQALERGRAFVAGLLHPVAPLAARARLDGQGGLGLEAASREELPLVVESVAGRPTGGRILPPWSGEGPLRWTDLPAPPTAAVGDTLRLLFRVLGGTELREHLVQVRPAPGPPGPATVSDAPASSLPPWLEEVAPGRLRARPGTWTVTEDLFLPPRTALELPAGTTLRFGPEAVLLVRGALRVEGSEALPVRLVPTGATWPGVVVLPPDQAPSLLQYLEVRSTRGVDRAGWHTTAGVTFQEAPVDLRRVRFAGHRGEDALNLIRSRFRMADCVFDSTFSDAFDGDFVEGVVQRCAFSAIGGDALDVSGSEVEVDGLRALHVADKVLSAGEDSRIEAAGLEVVDASIGAAAKDLSHLRLRDSRLERVHIALAAYTKKPVFGPAQLEASGLTLLQVDTPALVQEGSRVRLDGVEQPARELDVKELYRLGILGN